MKNIYIIVVMLFILILGIILSIDKTNDKELCEKYSNQDRIEMRFISEKEVWVDNEWISFIKIQDNCLEVNN